MEIAFPLAYVCLGYCSFASFFAFVAPAFVDSVVSLVLMARCSTMAASKAAFSDAAYANVALVATSFASVCCLFISMIAVRSRCVWSSCSVDDRVL
jgi:hypothetical protein